MTAGWIGYACWANGLMLKQRQRRTKNRKMSSLAALHTEEIKRVIQQRRNKAAQSIQTWIKPIIASGKASSIADPSEGKRESWKGQGKYRHQEEENDNKADKTETERINKICIS